MEKAQKIMHHTKRALELARLYHFTDMSSEEISEQMGAAPTAATSAAQRIPADYFYKNKIDPRVPIDWQNEPEPVKTKPKKNGKYKPIIETTKGMKFDSLQEAGRILEIPTASISKVLTGLCRHAKGYRFEYYDNE